MENSKTCPACGKQIAATSQFCGYCGHRYLQAPVTPTAASEVKAPSSSLSTLIKAASVIFGVLIGLAFFVTGIVFVSMPRLADYIKAPAAFMIPLGIILAFYIISRNFGLARLVQNSDAIVNELKNKK